MIREAEAMMNIGQAGITMIMVVIREIRIMETVIERKSRRYSTDMKCFLLLLTVIALLATSGCVMFAGGRNNSDDRNHPGNGGNDHLSPGMGQSEHPGGME